MLLDSNGKRLRGSVADSGEEPSRPGAQPAKSTRDSSNRFEALRKQFADSFRRAQGQVLTSVDEARVRERSGLWRIADVLPDLRSDLV